MKRLIAAPRWLGLRLIALVSFAAMLAMMPFIVAAAGLAKVNRWSRGDLAPRTVREAVAAGAADLGRVVASAARVNRAARRRLQRAARKGKAS